MFFRKKESFSMNWLHQWNVEEIDGHFLLSRQSPFAFKKENKIFKEKMDIHTYLNRKFQNIILQEKTEFDKRIQAKIDEI